MYGMYVGAMTLVSPNTWRRPAEHYIVPTLIFDFRELSLVTFRVVSLTESSVFAACLDPFQTILSLAELAQNLH